MLRSILSITVALVFTATACAPAVTENTPASTTASIANFEGSWKGSWSARTGRAGSLVFTLSKGEKGLGGTVSSTNAPAFTPDNVPRPINSLSVKGNDISISSMGVDGNLMSTTLTLDKSGARMTGWASDAGYTYWFDVTRQ